MLAAGDSTTDTPLRPWRGDAAEFGINLDPKRIAPELCHVEIEGLGNAWRDLLPGPDRY